MLPTSSYQKLEARREGNAGKKASRPRRCAVCGHPARSSPRAWEAGGLAGCRRAAKQGVFGFHPVLLKLGTGYSTRSGLTPDIYTYMSL